MNMPSQRWFFRRAVVGLVAAKPVCCKIFAWGAMKNFCTESFHSVGTANKKPFARKRKEEKMGYQKFDKCCKKPERKPECKCPESFCLHTKKIKPACGRCIPEVDSEGWGAAQALFNPCVGPFGCVTFVGTAHRLSGPWAKFCFDDEVTPTRINVHLMDCDNSIWCSFEASQCGEDFDECGENQGNWVTWKHECVVPSKEIAKALACGRVLLSVQTDSEDGVYGGETGEVRGIACAQELCYPELYRDVKCCETPKRDTCVKYTKECADKFYCGGDDKSASTYGKKSHKGGKKKGGCGCAGSSWY